MTKPSNADFVTYIPQVESYPPAGYSVTLRHWENSRQYEECVEHVAKRNYLDFVRDYYNNSRILYNYCRTGGNLSEEYMVNVDYKDYVFNLIIQKAHLLFYGQSSRIDFTTDECFRIEEHLDDKA